MKKLLFIFTLLITLSNFGQSNEALVFIKKNHQHKINKNSELLILENNDTLILTKLPIPKFVFPQLSSKKETQKFKSIYSYIAFRSFVNAKYNKHNLTLRQWNVPIKVFIDKTFHKKDRINIGNFIMQFSTLGIPNLKIELVKNKDDANYYITTTKELLEVLDKKKLDQYSVEQLKNRYVNNANYYLRSDNQKKIYSCVLKVNLKTFKSQEDLIRKIKKLFFGSLGRFYPIIYSNKESILNTKYENNDTISTFDINVLKTHYNYIYPYKVDFNLFKTIEKK